MKIKSLEDLLTDELRDLYSAEKQIAEALPKFIKSSQSQDLRSVFETHLGQTENQIKRLEQACSDLGFTPEGKKCVGMAGILEEGMAGMSNSSEAESGAMEAGMIGGAQRIEHYEIAGYGTAIAHARQLGFTSVADLLNQSLEEEKSMDEKLTKIARNEINVQAAMEA